MKTRTILTLGSLVLMLAVPVFAQDQGRWRGIVTENVEPLPSVLSTATEP